jgi:SAM-dependent MidA family methyltransferase
MHFLRPLPRRAATALLIVALATPLFSAEPRGELLNSWEIYNEIHVDSAAAPAVKESMMAFLDYQDLVMFHPKFGYYASGRVDFVQDYQTFPDALAPYFGHMIAHHIFDMWEGMRKAGTLTATEKFTVAEFGAGDGALAESILEYINKKAAVKDNPKWAEFSAQLVYACYDRSPALSAAQRKRNSRFGKRFEAREGDATDPTATIPAGSLKGVVLSNELPDAFSVQKVVLGLNGSAEVGYVAPALPPAAWKGMEKDIPAPLQARLKADNLVIQTKLFGAKHDDNVYLGREGFVALMESLSGLGRDYTDKVNSIEFHEIYLPIEIVPELADYIRRFIPAYAYELARTGKGFVSYVNLGEGHFIQGMGKILKAGYVFTIDYGSNWDSVTPLEFGHFRSYGPGSTTDHSNPYHSPTLNDMTTDVNFSHVMEDGKAVGLKPIFYGSQHTLITGTPVKLDAIPTGRDEFDYNTWVDNFHSWDVYKLLIEQKEGTDASYSFPDKRPEPLNVSAEALPKEQQALEAQIEQKLRARLK